MTTPRTTAVEIGRYYSPAFVAAIFNLSPEWARLQCDPAGRFPNAIKLDGGRCWLIPGSDVLAVIGSKQLELDRAAMAAALPTPSEQRKQVDAAMKRLQKQKAKKAKAKSAN